VGAEDDGGEEGLDRLAGLEGGWLGLEPDVGDVEAGGLEAAAGVGRGGEVPGTGPAVGRGRDGGEDGGDVAGAAALGDELAAGAQDGGEVV
jgi:hypothetical protein